MYSDTDLIVKDIELSGGPPWGFNLAGGSELGCPLFIKKVTDISKSVNESLLDGDEIVAVNHNLVHSRKDAIDMVRCTPEEHLTLQIRRKNFTSPNGMQANFLAKNDSVLVNSNSPYNTNIYPSRNHAAISSALNMQIGKKTTPTSTSDNMSSSSSSSSVNYRYMSSKANNSANGHLDSPSHSFEERGVDVESSETSLSPTSQRKLVSVKMTTAPQNRDVKNTVFKQYQTQQKLSRSFDQDDKVVERESLPRVSSARAIFEKMTTVDRKDSTTTIVKDQSKHLNTTQNVVSDSNRVRSAIDPNTDIKIKHQQSRSLPIEMAGIEYQKAVAAYKQHRANTKKGLNAYSKELATALERPKSAYYDKEENNNITTHNKTASLPPNFVKLKDQSELSYTHRSKSASQQMLNSTPRSAMASHSYEDLTSLSSKSKTRSAANELREAATRYHEELMKNYPKFRHSLSGKDNMNKFSRKTSMPPEDSFSRGEPYRATIATTSTARMPRSFSANETELRGVRSTYDPNDNSIMSRLLNSSPNHNILNKIDEEAKAAGGNSGIYTGLRRTSSEIRRTSQTNEYVKRNSPSIQLNKQEIDKSVCVKTEPADEETYADTPSRVDKHALEKDVVKSNRAFRTIRPKSAPLDHPSNMITETDIDSVITNPLEIIHKKEASTDSAVYMFEETLDREHSKDNSYDSSHDGDFFPPPPDDLLNDDESKENEKERPQRTINRRKKDSNVNTSRNNSCVSTDSTTSTATVDSGIRTDMSPRNSPVSSSRDHYYSVSSEANDSDVTTLRDEQPHATSTPERNQITNDENLGLPSLASVTSDRSSDETGQVMSIQSPRLDELDNEKAKLIDSMREKINELRDQEQEIGDEIRVNEDLGKKVRNMVENKATQSEFSKYELFIGELNKIVALLLSLTQRLHRYESMLQDLDMSNESDRSKKDGLVSKIEKLKSQHEEACYLRDVNDKRGDNVATFLEKYCSEEEFADFQYYVDMKSQLALMQSEIREKVKLGEERLKALQQTGNEWGFS